MRTQIFINNEWRNADSGEDARRHQPGDRRSRLRACRLRARAISIAPSAAARAALDGPWGTMSARERGRADLEARRAADGARRRDRAARDAPQRQADLRVAPDRDARGGRVLSVLRRLGRQDPRRDDSGQGQLPHLHAARAGRRRGRDRAVELSAAADGWKVAPALACGNTVVIKPASQTPLTAWRSPRSRWKSGFRPACSTSSPGRGRRSAR